MRCPHRRSTVTHDVPGGEEFELTHGERSGIFTEPRVLPLADPLVAGAHQAKNPDATSSGRGRGRSGRVCGEPPGGLFARAGPGGGGRAPPPLFAAEKSRPWPARSIL